MKIFFAAVSVLSIMGAVNPPSKEIARVAIIDLTNGSNHALLAGGWNRKRWVQDDKYHSTVRGGERYRFYGLTAKAGEATGGKAKLSEASGHAWQIEVRSPPASGESLIGLTGSWNAMPRKPQIVTEIAPFRKMVATALKRYRLSKVPINITRVLRVDLDGDGSAEEIISATCPRLAEDKGEALAKSVKEDYSIVLLHTRNGVTVLHADYGGEPDETPLVNEIAGVLDLNGDGTMEVVLRNHYYEGGGVRVFTFERGKARQVLYAIDGA